LEIYIKGDESISSIISNIFSYINYYYFIFFYLRKKYSVIKYIAISILLCFFEIFLCIFSLFINLFTAIGTLPDLREYNNKKDTNDNEPINGSTYNSGNNEESYLVSNGELSYGIIYLVIIIFEWLMLIFLCISDLIRIKLGINRSYNTVFYGIMPLS
jgi:hypothetical protein